VRLVYIMRFNICALRFTLHDITALPARRCGFVKQTHRFEWHTGCTYAAIPKLRGKGHARACHIPKFNNLSKYTLCGALSRIASRRNAPQSVKRQQWALWASPWFNTRSTVPHRLSHLSRVHIYIMYHVQHDKRSETKKYGRPTSQSIL